MKLILVCKDKEYLFNSLQNYHLFYNSMRFFPLFVLFLLIFATFFNKYYGYSESLWPPEP